MFELWHDVVETVVFALIFWPAPRRGSDAFAPKKKKSWVDAPLRVLRNVHQRFAPTNPRLLRATWRCLIAAFFLSWASRVSILHIPGWGKSPVSLFLDYAIVGMLIGCAVGFWAADRLLNPAEAEPGAAA
jgi:hypothetical protein